MTVLELIRYLLDHDLNAVVYVGKGMGPLSQLDYERYPGWVILSPDGKP